MDETSSPSTYRLELGGERLELAPGPYRLFLFDLVSRLLMEKVASRATFVIEGDESELDAISGHLFRHLRQQRCAGPDYGRYGARSESFRIHSVVDALVAVHFFFGAEGVPHFFVGQAKKDVLACLHRGRETRVDVADSELMDRLRSAIPS